VVYVHPRFDVESVDAAEQQEQMAGTLLGAGLQCTDEPWAYRLKRHLNLGRR
jgi:hypothetical protein